MPTDLNNYSDTKMIPLAGPIMAILSFSLALSSEAQIKTDECFKWIPSQ